ncbi:MAG: hypothetical protein EZS28_000620 [Streblomastix strix]|uniref:Uncharacterized protein n=1 Tax=Streblomastix strix TaxID=222440 RepID=A0A5J4XBG3_9EUKA|nr:MAG: hypothetical protein EZS28_000620 [Streblomastix strix]
MRARTAQEIRENAFQLEREILQRRIIADMENEAKMRALKAAQNIQSAEIEAKASSEKERMIDEYICAEERIHLLMIEEEYNRRKAIRDMISEENNAKQRIRMQTQEQNKYQDQMRMRMWNMAEERSASEEEQKLRLQKWQQTRIRDRQLLDQRIKMRWDRLIQQEEEDYKSDDNDYEVAEENDYEREDDINNKKIQTGFKEFDKEIKNMSITIEQKGQAPNKEQKIQSNIISQIEQEGEVDKKQQMQQSTSSIPVDEENSKSSKNDIQINSIQDDTIIEFKNKQVPDINNSRGDQCGPILYSNK